MALDGYHVCRTSSQSTKIYVPNCGYKLIYTLKLNMAAAEPIDTKVSLT
jgi:hypothetical protein